MERRAGPLGVTTFDIHLNGRAYWRTVPAAPLLPAEVWHFAEIARRIAAILMVTASSKC